MTCHTPDQCGPNMTCFVCADPDAPCPGDGTHYFRKDERPCKRCHRYMTDHEWEALK